MIPLFNRGRSAIMALLILNGLGQAVAALAAAFAVRFAFGHLDASQPAGVQQIAVVTCALVAATALTALLRARERIDAERLGQSYCHDLRVHLFEYLTAMSPRAVNARSQGSTALRFIGDVSAIRKWVSLGLSRLYVATTMVVGTLVAMSLVNPTLALATGFAALVGGIGALVQGPRIREATRQARRRRSRLAGSVTETIGAVGVVHANNAVDRERRRVRKLSRRLRDAMIERARRVGRLQAVAEATGSGAIAALLLCALVFGIGAPEVAAAMTVVGLLVPQLRGLARVQEYRQQQRVAAEAIARFLNRPPLLSEAPTPESLPSGPGLVELRDASLGMVQGITVQCRPGETVAVVGPNGAGKSTLFAMIGRLADLDNGQILLDDTDLAEVPLDHAHRAMGMAGPDLPLMRGSLRRNLTYQHRRASDEEIDQVVAQCDLTELVETLPDGLDSRIAEGGTNLSSGQRQRVLLARAVLGAPRVLLLDEADANLDAATTQVLDEILDSHKGVALIITHRRDRVEQANRVLHLAEGRLVESGAPEELLSNGGPTADLFRPDRPNRSAGKTRERSSV